MKRVPLLACAALLLVTLAGCLGDDDGTTPRQPSGDAFAAALPFSVLLCKDGYGAAGEVTQGSDNCNHRVTKPLVNAGDFNWTGQHGPGNEVSIAVNPTNPLNAAGGAKDYTVSYISDVAGCGQYNVWMGTYWTHDGGLTWGNDLMPGFPGDPRESPLSGNGCNTDPVLAFDDDGTLWYHSLNYRGAREDATTLPSPLGGHDLYSGSQVYFARSDDGGATYPADQITFASGGDNDQIFNDKNWFALQPGGDHMIATWSLFAPAGDAIFYTESQDDGQTWSAPVAMPPGTASSGVSVQFSMPQYLPGGDRVAVIWADFTQSGVRGGQGLSDTATLAYTEGTVTPAGTVFAPAQNAFSMSPLKSGANRDGTGPSTFRMSTYPVLAVDTSGGEYDGRRYVVWADQSGPLDSDVQVLMRWSDDGQTWSDPVTVNDVEAGDQFMPWIDVDPDGGVHVTWYDRRNDPDNRLLDVYYAYSDAGGDSFYPNLRVTETNFDGDLAHHQNGGPFIGDYIGVDATRHSAHIIWADTRHTGEPGRLAGSDVYAATILKGESARPLFDAAYDS